MSDQVPCCWGCLQHGHRFGCYCIPRAKRTVEVPVLPLRRLLDGQATDADRASLRQKVLAELR